MNVAAGALARVAARVAALMLVYAALQWWLFRLTTLDAASYAEASITLEVLRGALRVEVLLPLLALVVVCWRRPVWLRWSELEHGGYVRGFAVLVAVVLAWINATYDYNLFFDRAHSFDRAAILVTGALVAWRPVFVLPFVVVVTAVIRQFYEPIGGYSIAQVFTLVRILLLLVAALVLALATRRRSAVDWVFCSLALLASSYWTCGLGKLELGWLDYGHLYHLLPATYANGWLPGLGPDGVAELVGRVAPIDVVMRGFTIVVECGALLFFVHRAVGVALLAGWIAFHAGVFAMSGICFWNWVAVEVALLWFFARAERARRFPVFTPPYFVCSVVLILGSHWWFEPVNLSWFDSRISYTYRFEAARADGTRERLPPGFFAPYDYQFTLTAFTYLVDAERLPIVWGALRDRAAADALVAARTPEEVLDVERVHGTNRFDRERAARFRVFVARFVANFMARGSKRTWLSWARPPPQLWTYPAPRDSWDGVPIERVIVREVVSDWDGERYAEIRDEIVAVIEI